MRIAMGGVVHKSNLRKWIRKCLGYLQQFLGVGKKVLTLQTSLS